MLDPKGGRPRCTLRHRRRDGDGSARVVVWQDMRHTLGHVDG